MGPPFAGTTESLHRHRFGKIFVVDLILDRLEGRERLGRKRDRLAAAVGCRRGGTPGRLARQRIERGTDPAAQLDELTFGATRRDGNSQRVEVAAAIAE